MNKKSLSQFAGVIISLFAVKFINDLLIVDKCLDNGGKFDYQLGQCVLANGEFFAFEYSNALIGLYFFIAIIVAFSLSKLIQKVWR